MNMESFVIYTDYAKHLDQLTTEQCGVLFKAILAYAQDTTLPEMDPTTKMAFSFIVEQMIRDHKKWEETRKKRAIAGRMGGKVSAAQRRSKSAEASASAAASAEAGASVASSVEASEAVTGTVTDTVTVNENVDVNDASFSRFGKYGWIELSSLQHENLCKEFGDKEVERAIEYIDNSAQLTGNRNGWQDWELVLRRCIKEGWIPSCKNNYSQKWNIKLDN